jgi:hypothetical protein
VITDEQIIDSIMSPIGKSIVNFEDTPFRKKEARLLQLIDDINNSNYGEDIENEDTMDIDNSIDQVLQNALHNDDDSINDALTEPLDSRSSDATLQSLDRFSSHQPQQQSVYQPQEQSPERPQQQSFQQSQQLPFHQPQHEPSQQSQQSLHQLQQQSFENDDTSVNAALTEVLSPKRRTPSKSTWTLNNEGTINKTAADFSSPSPVKVLQHDPGRTPAVDHWEDRPEANSPSQRTVGDTHSTSSNEFPPSGPLHDIYKASNKVKQGATNNDSDSDDVSSNDDPPIPSCINRDDRECSSSSSDESDSESEESLRSAKR